MDKLINSGCGGVVLVSAPWPLIISYSGLIGITANTVSDGQILPY